MLALTGLDLRRCRRCGALAALRFPLRTTRKLTPTAEGLTFYEHWAALCASAIAAGESVGAARTEHGTVRLNASGAFAAAHLSRAIAAFLERHPGVQIDLTTDEGLLDLADGGEWTLTHEGRSVPVPVRGNLTSANAAFLREATLAGLGLAILPDFLIAPDIAAGRAVPVLEPHVDIDLAVHILMPHRTQLPGRSRRLVDFLVDRFTGNDWAHPDARG